MSCPKNILNKKFLWWEWEEEGDHDYKITSITKFMECSEHFVVGYKCSICGCIEKRHFVEMEELIREGFTAEQLSTYPFKSIYLNNK
jgi:hypothetical protein